MAARMVRIVGGSGPGGDIRSRTLAPFPAALAFGAGGQNARTRAMGPSKSGAGRTNLGAGAAPYVGGANSRGKRNANPCGGACRPTCGTCR